MNHNPTDVTPETQPQGECTAHDLRGHLEQMLADGGSCGHCREFAAYVLGAHPANVPVLAGAREVAADEREAHEAAVSECLRERIAVIERSAANRGADLTVDEVVLYLRSCVQTDAHHIAALAARPAPVVSREAATFDALLPVLAVAGEEAAPVVVRDASEFRIWTLTEDEDGEWWGWSWREEDEDWAPVRADYLRYPVTVLHAPTAALGITVADAPAAEPECICDGDRQHPIVERAGCPWHSPAIDDEEITLTDADMVIADEGREEVERAVARVAELEAEVARLRAVLHESQQAVNVLRAKVDRQAWSLRRAEEHRRQGDAAPSETEAGRPVDVRTTPYASSTRPWWADPTPTDPKEA